MSRLGFFFYWIFDNLQILAKVKFLEGVDKEKAAKRAAFFWLLGLIFSVILVVIQMIETSKEEAQLKRDYAEQRALMDERQINEFKAKNAAIAKKKFDNTLNLLKNLGDMVTASQGVSLPKTLFGFDFNDGQVGLGGFISAVITCYQLYPDRK